MCKRFRLGVGIWCDVSQAASGDDDHRTPERQRDEKPVDVKDVDEKVLLREIRDEIRCLKVEQWRVMGLTVSVLSLIGGVSVFAMAPLAMWHLGLTLVLIGAVIGFLVIGWHICRSKDSDCTKSIQR